MLVLSSRTLDQLADFSKYSAGTALVRSTTWPWISSMIVMMKDVETGREE
jgi:hypothetical protein